MTENISRKSKAQRIKYLPLDVERRPDANNNFTTTSVSMIGLNTYLDTNFHHDVFLLCGKKFGNFADKAIKKQFFSTANYMAYAWRPEWFVEALFNALQYGRDGNIEIVAHNASHDVKVLKKLFHEHGYPFYWNDYGFENAKGKEGLFSHNIHDTRLIGQLLRVNKNKLSGGDCKSTLAATAEALGMNIDTDLLHTSSYDCYLTTRIFIESQELLECYYQSKNELNRAADIFDYLESDEKFDPTKSKND